MFRPNAMISWELEYTSGNVSFIVSVKPGETKEDFIERRNKMAKYTIQLALHMFGVRGIDVL